MKFEEFDSLDLDLGIGKEDKMPDVVKPAPAAPAEPYPQQPYGAPAEPYPQQPYGAPAEQYPQQPYGVPAEPYPQQPYGAPAEPYPQQPYGAPAESYPQQPYGAPAEPYPQQPYGAPAEQYPQQPYGAPAEPYPQQPYGAPAEPYPQQPYGAPAEPYPQQPYGAPAEPYPQQPYGAPQQPYPPQQYPIYGGYPVPPKPKKRVPVILLSVIAAVVLISVVLILTGVFSGGKGNVPEEPPMANEESAAADHVGKPLDPAVVTTAPVVEEEEPAVEIEATPAPTVPVNQQIVEVTSSGSTGVLTLREWQNGEWVELMSAPAYLGRNGISENKVDGDGCTPAGTFDILFYMSLSDMGSALNYVPVTSGDIWVVDTDSPSYNTLRNENDSGDWNYREVEYIYNMFVNGMTSARIMFSYNGDGQTSGSADRGGGSAIFIDGTASSSELTRGYGDILITAEEITLLLSYLDSAKNPILVVQ